MDLKDIFETVNKIEENETIKISYYIIKYCKDEKIELTNLKLNKLLYFINIVYMLENNGVAMFEEKFLAWRHGPVLQSVYNQFCFGLTLPPNDKLNLIIRQLSTKRINTINKVLERKATLSAWQLVEQTHIAKGPWESIYQANKDINGICKAAIPNKKIYDFYKEHFNEI